MHILKEFNNELKVKIYAFCGFVGINGPKLIFLTNFKEIKLFISLILVLSKDDLLVHLSITKSNCLPLLFLKSLSLNFDLFHCQ